jgi:hypothetical protein
MKKSFKTCGAAIRECRDSSEPDAVGLQAAALARAVPQSLDQPAIRPSAFAAFVAKPPLRISVDPQALTISCALHAGEVALLYERRAQAADHFRFVIRNFSAPSYAYYVARAQAALTLMASESVSELRLVSTP